MTFLFKTAQIQTSEEGEESYKIMRIILKPSFLLSQIQNIVKEGIKSVVTNLK